VEDLTGEESTGNHYIWQIDHLLFVGSPRMVGLLRFLFSFKRSGTCRGHGFELSPLGCKSEPGVKGNGEKETLMAFQAGSGGSRGDPSPIKKGPSFGMTWYFVAMTRGVGAGATP